MPTRENRESNYLTTLEDIVAYLNAEMEEWDDGPRLFMRAFRDVAEAREASPNSPGERNWIDWRSSAHYPPMESTT